jgi:MFS superfamily sulfate permease-like transporter
MGLVDDLSVLLPCSEHLEAERIPHSIVVRPSMSLYYANASLVLSRIRKQFIEPLPPDDKRTLVLDCSGINFIDETGRNELVEFEKELAALGHNLAFIYARRGVERVLATDPELQDLTVYHNIAELLAGPPYNS